MKLNNEMFTFGSTKTTSVFRMYSQRLSDRRNVPLSERFYEPRQSCGEIVSGGVMRVEEKRAVRRRVTNTMSNGISLPLEHVLSTTGEIIEQASLIFDPIWYVEEYPDIGTAGVDPVQHFLNVGFTEGRNPNRYFDGLWYAETYPDVAAHGENPFVHYVFYGAREGRKPRAGM